MVILNLETENQNVVDLSTQQLVQFPPFSEDTFLYVFYFFSSLSSGVIVACRAFSLSLLRCARSSTCACEFDVVENKLIDIYLITTNNTSESVYGHMYKQLPPLMVFVKYANSERPLLFCIGSIMMKLNTKLIPSFNQKLISKNGRS